ncbi:cysteine synthase [Bacteroidia bacterium]|nr:cysteine synthase [Bacteroidia bacterium]
MELLDCIGNSPLVRLPDDFTKTDATILVKLEEFNLGGSIKSRVAKQMIIDAEEDGRINVKQPQSVTILEASGGNTGIGLAQICAMRGYKCILTIPTNYSEVRVKILQSMGAEVVRSDASTGNDSHFRKAEELLGQNPHYLYMDQINNPSNVKAHYLGTGQEILLQSKSQIDYFVAGIGSGGTITGIGKAIKEKVPSCKIIGVQPTGCDVLNGKSIPHKFQGFAIGKIPKILDVALIDEMIDVTYEEVAEMKNHVSSKLGLYLGDSSIANMLGAIYLSKDTAKGKTIVTVAPDGGRNYDIKID